MLKASVGASCSVCQHPEREAIDTALRSGDYTQVSIAEQFGVHRASLVRHAQSHLHRPVKRPPVVRDEAAPIDPAEELEASARRLRATLDEAEAKGLPRRDLAAINREYRQTLSDLAKVKTEAEASRADGLSLDSKAWERIRTKLAEAVAPYPEARRAVAAALRKVDLS